MNTIAIDCGASFIKGALFGCSGSIIKSIDRKSPVVHMDEPITNPIQIVNLMKEIKVMIKELAGVSEEIILALSNEMHGFIIADACGNPVTDYISWQKEYGDGEQLKKEDFREEIKKTGMGLRAGLPSCNLIYLIKSDTISDDGQRYFLTLGDYILFSLSGKVPFCHPTNAAGTGLYDIIKQEWNRKLIEGIGAESISFPCIGESVLEFEIDGIKIYAPPALGDQQAALLGAGLVNETDVSFNLGTGAQVSTLVSEVSFSDSFQIRPYFGGKYLKTIPHLPSGRSLNVYFRFVKDLLAEFGVDADDDLVWSVLLKNISGSRNTDIKCDLSFFDNAMTGHNKGNISEIGEYDFTICNVMNAVICTMADNFISASKTIIDDVEDIKGVFFSGGIARRIPKLREIILKQFQNVESVTVAENETLYGLYKYSNHCENV